MELKKLSDADLLNSTKKAVAVERDAILCVLRHLREVERRMLYSAGQSTLFAYCTEDLGYDAGAATNRINAMRLLHELPEVEAKVESGALNLTLLSQAHSFLKKEGIRNVAVKREIVHAIAGKSTREAQRELMSRTSTPEIHVPDKIKLVSPTHSEVRFLADETLLEELETLKALLAHSHPGASLKDILQVAVRESIQKRIPKAPAPRARDGKDPLKHAEIRRIVWHRDGGKCTQCGTRYALELDHIQPKAKGGKFTVENLRLRCRTHNQLAAIQEYGHDKMQNHLPKLRP